MRGRRGLACAGAVLALWASAGGVRGGSAWSAWAQPVQVREEPADGVELTPPSNEGKPAGVQPMPLPGIDAGVAALLEQPYLTDAERAQVRARHGVWLAGDLEGANARARVALAIGAFGHAALAPDQQGVDATLRAEAQLRLGEPALALELLDGAVTARAARLHGEALLELGRLAEAEESLAAAAERAQGAEDADELAEAARALTVLARLRGAEGPAGVSYQETLALLAHARDTLDRLSWRANLSEALLLAEKDRFQEAGEALEAALLLNPRAAETWLLLGRLSVDGFDFPRAERVAARLDALAALDLSADADAGDVAEATPPAPSLLGTLVRALVRLRQNEGAEALEVLAPVLAAHPEHRELRAMQAAATALAFDFEGADRLLAGFDQLAPASPAAYLAAGRAVALARQYEEAARLLRVASERAPLWAEPAIELGLSELQAGNLEASKAALEHGLRLDRFNLRAQNSLTLLNEIETYTTRESEHFVVRFKPGVDELLVEEMLPVLDRIHARVTGDAPGGIRHEPARKTVLELYPNHRWFSTRITGLPQLHTFAAATGPVIAMEAPRSGPGHLVGPYDWPRVVQHEYTHTVTLSRTRNRLPHWFTEASAVYLEDAPKDFGTVQILARALDTGALFDFETINVMFVRPRRPSDRAQAYAQGAWMYEFMIQGFGEESPLRLMDEYARGVREAEAFQSVLGVSREDFLERFSVWALEELRAWGMAAREGQKTIDELLTLSGADEPTPQLVDRWRGEHPDNPFVLALAVRAVEARASQGPLSGADVELLRAFARARPVDPLPHRLLARHFLASAPADAAPHPAIAHLEYLDAREQHDPSFAMELARLYASDGDAERSLVKLRRGTAIAPYDPRVREQAATVALRLSDLREAERHVRALTLIEPDRPIHQQRLEAVRRRMQ